MADANVPRELLAVFARAPELGRVKTRLCPPLSQEEALALYRALVEDTLETFGKLARPSVAKHLLLTKPLARKEDLEIPSGWSVGVQSEGDLGRRLASLFFDGFRSGVERVVVLGSDSPTLPLEVVDDAFDHLASTDFVLGPAEDGGYYLLGARVWVPEIFEEISWGTSEVLAQTRARLDSLNRGYELLIPWYDIDRSEDLEKLRQELSYLERARPHLAPRHLAQVLGENRAPDDYRLEPDYDF